MAFVTLATDHLRIKGKLSLDHLPKEHTYLMILCKEQKHFFDEFNEFFKNGTLKLVWQQPIPAVNKTPGHGKGRRNFMIIFEFNE